MNCANPGHNPPATTRTTDDGPVLIVEENASSTLGHYAELFADLAGAIRDRGRSVALLTSEGWVLADDPSFGALDVFEFGPITSGIFRLANRMDGLQPRRAWRLLTNVPRSVAILSAARARRRRIGGSGVIAMGRGVHPLVAAVTADSGRWLVYRFDEPAGWLENTRSNRLMTKILLALTRRAEQVRRRRGGFVKLVVNNRDVLERWQAVAPWLRPAFVPFAMCRVEERLADARARLGLDRSARIALSFGAPHGGKDLATVWEAFGDLEDWQLVVAGNGAADAYRAWACTRSSVTHAPILFDGYVNRETRALLYSAADVSVLSFRPGTTQDSATLTDSLTWAVPILCSDGCPAADVVRKHRLGALFQPRDPASLRAMLDMVPDALDAQALAAARDELSSSRTAARLLALLELDSC